MDKHHFNELAPDEAERLAIIAEECGEVIQVVGKILRHGYSSFHPNHPGESNRALLAQEIGDLSYVIQWMIHKGDVSQEIVLQSKMQRSARMASYLHHQNTPPEDYDMKRLAELEAKQ